MGFSWVATFTASNIYVHVSAQGPTSGIWRLNDEIFTFQTGDFATAIVTSEAGCECNRGHWLNWVVVREGQYVAFGQARPEVSTGQCVYKIG